MKNAVTKKRLWILLACVLLSCNAWAFADESWTVTSTGALSVKSGVTLSGAVIIPETVDGRTVTSLSTAAFNNQTDVTSIVMPDTIQAMSGSAITFLDGVTSLKLSENLTVIGDMNGHLKGLTQLTMPASVRYIGDSFTSLQSLQSLTFEGVCPVFDSDDPLHGINQSAVIYVPDDQVEAYREALAGGYGIERMVQPSGKNAVIYSSPIPETDFAFDAASGTITGYTGTAAYLEIPATIGGAPVKAIGEKAFSGNAAIVYLVIPEGMESIGAEAFAQCSGLTVIDFSTTLRSIGDSAFSGCNLTSIRWAEGLEEIGAYAFECLVVRNLYLPSTVRTIGEGAFKDGTIQHLRIGNAIESIGQEAFANNALNYIELLTDRMIEIDETAFEGNTDYTDIDLRWSTPYAVFEEYELLFSHIYPGSTWMYIGDPIGDESLELEYPADGSDSYSADVWVSYNGTQPNLMTWWKWNGMPITTLGDGLFKGNQTIRSWYPSHAFTFHHIGNEAFADSSVEIVDLCYSVETIGDAAFRNCINIKEITLPATLKSIAVNAFEGCTGLEKITILCDPSIIPEGLLNGCTAVKEISAGPDATEEENLMMAFAIYGMPEVNITLHPVDVTVAKGETATVTVHATGENLSYAWYEGINGDLRLGENGGGEVYSVEMNEERNGLQVYCVVTDIYGTSVTSETATLRMLTPLELLRQPADAAAAEGANAEVCVEASGDGLLYQWYINDAPVDGANADSLSVAMSAEYDGAQAYCIVTDAYGDSITSDKAVLKLPAELAITAQPEDVELPEGEMAEISVEATGDGLTYHWYVMPGDSSEYTLAEGFTTDVYSVVVDESSDWSSVYCQITDAYGNTVTSDSASIFIAEEKIEIPEDAAVDAAMVGHWNSVRAEVDGEVIEREMLVLFGLNIRIDLHEDGSAVMFAMDEEMDGLGWLATEDTLYLTLDGDVLPIPIVDGTLVFEDCVLEKEDFAPASASGDSGKAFTSEPAEAMSVQDRMNRKFVATTYSALGQTFDASMLGAEYSLFFREDGTCDLTMAGSLLPALPWKQEKVAVNSSEADAFVINFYGTIYNAVLVEDGFDMDYFGTMTLHFVAAQE